MGMELESIGIGHWLPTNVIWGFWLERMSILFTESRKTTTTTKKHTSLERKIMNFVWKQFWSTCKTWYAYNHRRVGAQEGDVGRRGRFGALKEIGPNWSQGMGLWLPRWVGRVRGEEGQGQNHEEHLHLRGGQKKTTETEKQTRRAECHISQGKRTFKEKVISSVQCQREVY